MHACSVCFVFVSLTWDVCESLCGRLVWWCCFAIVAGVCWLLLLLVFVFFWLFCCLLFVFIWLLISLSLSLSLSLCLSLSVSLSLSLSVSLSLSLSLSLAQHYRHAVAAEEVDIARRLACVFTELAESDVQNIVRDAAER